MRWGLSLLLLVLVACRPQRPTAAPERQQLIEGLTLNQSERGKPKWTLRSRLTVLREDDKLAVMTEPDMDFYREGRAVSRVTARTGTVHTESHDVRLSSSVVLDSFDDHSHLTTDDLTYSSKLSRFVTSADVTVRRPEGILRGQGLEATPDLSEIRIRNQRSVLRGRPR